MIGGGSGRESGAGSTAPMRPARRWLFAILALTIAFAGLLATQHTDAPPTTPASSVSASDVPVMTASDVEAAVIGGCAIVILCCAIALAAALAAHAIRRDIGIARVGLRITTPARAPTRRPVLSLSQLSVARI